MGWLFRMSSGIALMVFAARALVAQDTTKARPDSTKPTELSPVVVTATRTPRTVSDLPVSTTVVRGEEIRATPALTLDDAIRTVPGLNIPFESAVVAHYTSNAISMRGIGGYVTTLVLLDGIPLNDPMSGYVPWGKVPAQIVDHVEVVRGGNSSLYGTYALGGVVNIITRRPDKNQFGAGVSYGTNNTVRAGALGSVELSPTARLTLNGTFYDTDGYIRPIPEDRGPIDENGWSRAGNGLAQLDLRLSEQTTAFLRANYFGMYQSQGSPLGRDGQHIFDLGGGLQRHSASGTAISATAFYQHDAPWTDNTDPITTRGTDEFVSNSHHTPADFFGGSLLWSRLISNGHAIATAGLDAHVVIGDDSADVYAAPDSFLYHEVGGGTQLTGGIYAQLEYFATPRIELLGSVRVDGWQNINGHHNQTPGEHQSFETRTETSVNPKFALRYHAADAVTLRGAVYRAFNAPNLDELYRPYSAASYANVPNPELGPETLVGGEVGLEYAAGPASLQANVFQNNLSDVITYNPISFDPVYTTQPVNVGKVRTRGIEVFGNVDLTSGWRMAGSYTYTESIITENPPDPSVEGNTQGDTPNHMAAASIGYFGHRWTAFVQGRYVGRRYSDISNTVAIDPYFVTDLSGTVSVGGGFEAYLALQNVFDKVYVVSEYGFRAQGTPRQLFAGFRTRLSGGGS